MKKKACIDCGKETKGCGERCISCAVKDSIKKGKMKIWKPGQSGNPKGTILKGQNIGHSWKIGEKHPWMEGEKHHNYGHRGEDSYNWRGGHEVSRARSDLSRIGFSDALPLNKWYLGSVRHHITNHYTVYIPEEIHKRCAYPNREVHRRKVMEAIKHELPILFSDITMYIWNSTEVPMGIKLSD